MWDWFMAAITFPQTKQRRVISRFFKRSACNCKETAWRLQRWLWNMMVTHLKETHYNKNCYYCLHHFLGQFQMVCTPGKTKFETSLIHFKKWRFLFPLKNSASKLKWPKYVNTLKMGDGILRYGLRALLSLSSGNERKKIPFFRSRSR